MLLEMAARCLPAAGHLVGGDWYDIIPLPAERTGLVVGDVMGHGPEAAAVMAQLRAAAHALAQLDLPPVLAQPDGTTRTLDLPIGQSLGLGPMNYGQARIKLAPGTTLALYTDGLVETRTRSFDQGILALRAQLARADDPLDTICDALIRTLASHSGDDVTLILTRIPH